MNSLSGISHLSVDTLILIFPPQTPRVDFHQLQPLSVYQTFEKIMKAMKKHRKLMLFMYTLAQWTEVSCNYFIPQQSFQTILLSLNLGNPPPPPPLPFLKGFTLYFIIQMILNIAGHS